MTPRRANLVTKLNLSNTIYIPRSVHGSLRSLRILLELSNIALKCHLTDQALRKGIELHIILIKHRFEIILHICWPSITNFNRWWTDSEYMTQITTEMLHNRNLSPFMTYHGLVTKVTRRLPHVQKELAANTCGTPEFTADFQCVRDARFVVLCVLFCRFLFVVLSVFLIWPFCPPLYGFRLLIWYLQTFLFMTLHLIF